MNFVGDFLPGQNIRIPFNTYDSNNDPVAPTATGSLRIGEASGDTSSAGSVVLSQSVSNSALIGSNYVEIQTGSLHFSSIYKPGTKWSVQLIGLTVDGKVLSPVIGSFSLDGSVNSAFSGRSSNLSSTEILMPIGTLTEEEITDRYIALIDTLGRIENKRVISYNALSRVATFEVPGLVNSGFYSGSFVPFVVLRDQRSFAQADRQTLQTIDSNQVTTGDIAGLSTFDADSDLVGLKADSVNNLTVADDAIGTAKISDAAKNSIRDKVLDEPLAGSHDVAGSLGKTSQDSAEVAVALGTSAATKLQASAEVVITSTVDTTAGPATTTTFKTASAELLAMSDVQALRGRGVYFRPSSANPYSISMIQSAQKTDGDTYVELTVATVIGSGRLLGSLTTAPLDDDKFTIVP